MAPLSTQQVERIVREALKSVLPRTKIESILAGKEDAYLDTSIDILVVVTNGATVSLRGEQLAKLQSALRKRMAELGDDRFPLLRFMTASEAKKNVA